MTTRSPLHPAGTQLSCPACGRRIHTTLPDQTAVCAQHPHGRPHPPAAMTIINDADSREQDH